MMRMREQSDSLRFAHSLVPCIPPQLSRLPLQSNRRRWASCRRKCSQSCPRPLGRRACVSEVNVHWRRQQISNAQWSQAREINFLKTKLVNQLENHNEQRLTQYLLKCLRIFVGPLTGHLLESSQNSPPPSRPLQTHGGHFVVHSAANERATEVEVLSLDHVFLERKMQ